MTVIFKVVVSNYLFDLHPYFGGNDPIWLAHILDMGETQPPSSFRSTPLGRKGWCHGPRDIEGTRRVPSGPPQVGNIEGILLEKNACWAHVELMSLVPHKKSKTVLGKHVSWNQVPLEIGLFKEQLGERMMTTCWNPAPLEPDISDSVKQELYIYMHRTMRWCLCTCQQAWWKTCYSDVFS